MDARILKLQREGEKLYSGQDYPAALKCFSQVVDGYTEVPLEVLDGRAAVHVKLGKLKAALRDGERMIKTWQTNAAGYLRTAQVLLKMGKGDRALGIYEYGLRSVSSQSPKADILTAMHEKLRKKAMPAGKVDPFARLPLELVEMIAGYLSFNQLVYGYVDLLGFPADHW